MAKKANRPQCSHPLSSRDASEWLTTEAVSRLIGFDAKKLQHLRCYGGGPWFIKICPEGESPGRPCRILYQVADVVEWRANSRLGRKLHLDPAAEQQAGAARNPLDTVWHSKPAPQAAKAIACACGLATLPPDKFITTRELSERLGFSVSHWEALRKETWGPVFHVIGTEPRGEQATRIKKGRYYYRAPEVQAWLASFPKLRSTSGWKG